MPHLDIEHVLVVPTDVFRRLGYFQGFSADVDRYLDELLSPEFTSYQPRPEMERDPSFKQLIPYVIFQHRTACGEISVFQYRRGKGQGEQRLHLKRSVGIGGHISSDDDQSHSDLDPYREGMRRELDEEVAIGTTYQDRLVGLINDDESEVGRVHLGVVHVFDVAQPAVRPRESEIMDSGFRPVQELLGELAQFESWSAICLRALYGQE